MNTTAKIFSRFHPLVAQWFTRQYGQPTDVQAQAWPKIVAGEHVLVTAPTGSGKTLTAFLWAINQLVTKQWPTGHTSVLYVSPLKALNNDIQRNLLTPLEQLKQVFAEAGEAFPDIRVATRSGDTPPSDRRRMQRRPPEILITTPESLNLMLSSAGGRSILSGAPSEADAGAGAIPGAIPGVPGVATVILDEIHAVVGNKRGVHLITAVDRLVDACGEFQRIALSATIRPLETVAEFVGGFLREGDVHEPRYRPRSVSVVCSHQTKRYDLAVRFPDRPDQPGPDSFWDPFVEQCKHVIDGNRSTLLFTNSRRLCEHLTLRINDGQEPALAYAHHGSLSREIRSEIEQRLKTGDLAALVATNSLELGIDIGSLDEVVLIQSPASVSSAVQRVGRAGHQVGQVSRGTLFPTHPLDLVEAAVLAAGVRRQDIEAIGPVQCPLDVLAQVIISMVGEREWDIDELHVRLKTSYPYRHLTRVQFDLVLNLLAGRYADSRVRELKPRVSIDRLDNTIVARKGALQTLYISGGVIPDRGYFHLRHHETNARIGELDEEFVWEASVGQVLTLGTQSWKIQRITHNDVFVLPADPKSATAPFWKGELYNRDFHFSDQIGRFLAEANQRLDDSQFAAFLRRDHCLDAAAADQLLAFLKSQKETTACDLPHRNHLVVESVSSEPGGAPGHQVVLHTFWGGRVNRPFALALEAAWEKKFRHPLEVYVANDLIVLQMPEELPGHELLSLVTGSNVESLLRRRLEGSGFFGARFRECAGRALLLTRDKLNQRMPLWVSRLRSQKLLASVLPYEDFPILLEAWRTCLQDEFDLENLKLVLTDLESGESNWSQIHTTHPSPFARSVSWRQINQYMYMDDQLRAGAASNLRSDLIREVALTPGLRPTVSRSLVEQFELKRQRLIPGYSPQSARDLLDWVKERIIIPKSEWEKLLEAIRSDGEDPHALVRPVGHKLVRVNPPGAPEEFILALETMHRVVPGLYGTADDVRVETLDGQMPAMALGKSGLGEEDRGDVFTMVLSEWLQFYGPRPAAFIRATLGIENRRLEMALQELADTQKVVQGELVADGGEQDICDTENFDVLLRLARADAAVSFEPLGIGWLPLFIARHQGITNPSSSIDGLYRGLEQLLCYPAAAELWETEILPARTCRYDTSWLDTMMQEGELRWLGHENRRVSFCLEQDLDLMQEEGASLVPLDEKAEEHGSGNGNALTDLFPDERGRYDFSTLLRLSNAGAAALADQLWDAVWRGQVTNDTFVALRRGIENRFQVPDVVAKSRRGQSRRTGLRSGFARWKNAVPLAGNWYRVSLPDLDDDLLESEERKKDRVRLLLDRYGVLFREIVQRELPAFRWPTIFRSLRLMELSGEILAGCFFHGVPGPQFISHAAFRLLQRLPEETIFWINATDPASLCGVPLDSLRGTLPKRLAGTHLVYRGSALVLVSQRHGRDLKFDVPPDVAQLPEYLGVLRHLLTRQFQPIRRITIETINGEPASGSAYLDALRNSFDVAIEYKDVVLFQKMVG